LFGWPLMTDGRQNILQQHRACAFFCLNDQSTNHACKRRLANVNSHFSTRFLRLLLAISVSLWISGAGCLWGCSKMAMASTSQPSVRESSVTAHSCHAKAHDCCAKKSRQTGVSQINLPNLSALGVLNEGMMTECPMAVNASAIVSKANPTSLDTTQVNVVAIPFYKVSSSYRVAAAPPVEFLNRGPTYLRCCTFLI